MTMTLFQAVEYVRRIKFRPVSPSDLGSWLAGGKEGDMVGFADENDGETTDGLDYAYIPADGQSIELYFNDPTDGLGKRVIQWDQ